MTRTTASRRPTVFVTVGLAAVLLTGCTKTGVQNRPVGMPTSSATPSTAVPTATAGPTEASPVVNLSVLPKVGDPALPLVSGKGPKADVAKIRYDGDFIIVGSCGGVGGAQGDPKTLLKINVTTVDKQNNPAPPSSYIIQCGSNPETEFEFRAFGRPVTKDNRDFGILSVEADPGMSWSFSAKWHKVVPFAGYKALFTDYAGTGQNPRKYRLPVQYVFSPDYKYVLEAIPSEPRAPAR